MNDNKIKHFFDAKSSLWDEHNKMSQEEFDDFFKFVPLQEGMKCLDIACGTGVVSPFLYGKTKRQVKAIDLSNEMIEIAKEKHSSDEIDFECADLYKYDGKDFDIAIMFNCYPHFKDVEGLVEKLYQLLKKGGYFAIVHNLSKEALNEHHAHMDKDLFRDLQSAVEESKAFSKRFNLLRLIDESDRYLILGQKR